jgi:hypothetical protein
MDDRDVIRSFEGVANKRVVALIAVVVIVVVVLIVVVVGGFRGKNISKGAEAVTKGVVSPTQVGTQPAPVK